MIYVYRRAGSAGARELAESIMLKGTRARRTKGLALRNLQPGDAVVCWGDSFTAPAGVKTLNNVVPVNKFREAQILTEKGVPTVKVSQTRPVVQAARPPFVEQAFQIPVALLRQQLSVNQAQQLRQLADAYLQNETARRQAWERQPAVPAEIWLPRRNNHVGGNDLLTENLQDANFYSKKEEIVEEYRLHMFNGKSIRAGRKVQRQTRPDGRTAPHQWIRSFDAGWVIQYDGFQSTKEQRKIAADAVKALDLTFAAVDIGKKADGTYIVLEVNRAPGVEGNTIEAYAQKIIAWASGQEENENAQPARPVRRG